MYNPQLETFLHVADAGRNPLASGFLTAATGG